MTRSSGETSAHVSDMKRRALTRSRRRISLPFSPFPFSARYRRAVGFKQERSPPFGHGRCWRKRQRKLDNFDFLLLDDLGYLPQGAEESEVLFTLIAERYERRSLGITSNLVFSEWERIFANPMATAAAIDRVVHNSVILGFAVPSFRTDAAQQRGQSEEVNRQK